MRHLSYLDIAIARVPSDSPVVEPYWDMVASCSYATLAFGISCLGHLEGRGPADGGGWNGLPEGLRVRFVSSTACWSSMPELIRCLEGFAKGKGPDLLSVLGSAGPTDVALRASRCAVAEAQRRAAAASGSAAGGQHARNQDMVEAAADVAELAAVAAAGFDASADLLWARQEPRVGREGPRGCAITAKSSTWGGA
jgi:hypothetical protein